MQVGDDDSHGVEHDQLRGDLLEELELKRERPAFPAHFVCHLHPHEVKIGRGAVRLLGVGLNPQNDAGDLQFTPRHAPDTAAIRIAAERDGEHVAISVADEGRGIAPERLGQLFRKYAAAPKIVRAYVKRLRDKLGDEADRPALIVNERGVGYRMARPGDR